MIAAIAGVEFHYRSDPPEGILELTYILSSSCTQAGGYEVVPDGNHFDVRVFNTEPAGYRELCDRVGIPGDHHIPVDGLEAGREVTVSVNGVSLGTLTVPTNEEEYSVALPVPDTPEQVETTPTGYRVEIGLGRAVELPGQDIVITFDRVVRDSRCPANVTCVRTVEAAIGLTVHRADPSTGALLSLGQDSGLDSPWTRVAVHPPESEDIEIRLMSLEPYPGAEDDRAGVTPRAVLEIMVDERQRWHPEGWRGADPPRRSKYYVSSPDRSSHIGLLSSINSIFPLSTPRLQPFLPRDRTLHRRVCLIPHQRVYPVLLRESLHQVQLVLPHSSAQVGCDPYI